MNTKTTWLRAILLAGVLTAAGCAPGSRPATPNPGPPILNMNTSSVDFGDVAVGAVETQVVTLSNLGASPLILLQNSVSGSGITTSGVGSAVTLAPGQYVTLAVNFNPSGPGKTSGAVSLTSNSSTSPINLPVSGNGLVASHWVTFDWAASKSTVVGYNVYLRSASDQSWSRLNASPVPVTSYTDWDAQSGQIYMFAVTSVSPTNEESAFSNATSATIPSP